MKAVIQRVNCARVTIEDKLISEIEKGLVVLLGVEKSDTSLDAEFLAKKIIELRCFEDENGKMNISLEDAGGELLVISEVTLCTDLQSGRRPGFEKAASPETAERLYQEFIKLLSKDEIEVKEGQFKAHMVVRIDNDGPVTFILNSHN